MKITITGRNIELTDGLKDAVNDRLSKLDKYFAQDTEVQVTLSVEKERQKVEVTIPVKGTLIRAEQVSSDMYVSPTLPLYKKRLFQKCRIHQHFWKICLK